MKHIKPAQVYSAVISICAFLLVLLLFRQLWNLSSSNFKNSADDIRAIQISKDSLLPSFYGDEDPFTKGNYLNKKFLQLVASTHLTLQSSSGQSKNATKSFDYVYFTNELMVTINVKNFYARWLGCKNIAAIQVKEMRFETPYNVLYHGLYQNNGVGVKVAKANVDELIGSNCGSSDSDHSKQNLDRCFLLKNRKILDEAALLTQLHHKNIAKILGLCVQRGESNENLGEPISSAGVILIKEGGMPVQIEKLKSFDWEDRIKLSSELLNLAVYLSNSPLGSIRLANWRPENFFLHSQTKRILLQNVDDLFYFSEPSCKSDKQCYIDNINCGLRCVSEHCDGYNAKKNLFDLNQAFLSPLLRYNVPRKLSEPILKVLMSLNTLKISSTDAIHALQEIMPKNDKPLEVVQPVRQPVNPAILSMQKLPDGSQVDSWEQHEGKVAINDVVPPAFKEPIIAENQQDSPEMVSDGGFRKIENADFPGRYDYYCPGSKAVWGCVMSLQTPEDAMLKCVQDDKCKAFVTIPHIRKEGWIIVIMKSDNFNPVDHAGTTVYVRSGTGGAPLPKKEPQDDTKEIKKQEDCLDSIIKSQSKLRQSLEESLMKACGWPGMSDKQWSTGVAEGKVTDATSFKPARGKLANGGQMDIVVTIGSNSYSSVFLAKHGPDEFDVSQLAVFQLDRILGLYKTVPAIERQMSDSELSEAGFPVDIGGNQFDKFRSLKKADGSLLGVIYPKITERVSLEHYISVPRLSGVTNAVTPFTKKQWDDLEYLLLGFLASIPFSAKGHQSVRGRLLHLKTEEAFLRDPPDYLSYFYNCQFPSHVIDVLRDSDSRHCDVGSAIQTRLLNDNSPKISDILKQNIRKLLDLVDKCVTRFGKQVVLYDTEPSKR